MMINIRFIAVLGSLLIVLPCMAGQIARHNLVHRNANKESAVEFAEKYHAHLNRGMSMEHLISYWSEDKVREFEELAATMADFTGKEPAMESQRLMDLMYLESRCEKLDLTNVKTYGMLSQMAKLYYVVSYTCTKWKEPSKRTMTLRFLTVSKHWYIDKIEDEEL
jgi:hypothetical protein